MPMARRSVLLPDMFEPVTTSASPGGFDGDVVRDALVGVDERMTQVLAAERLLFHERGIHVVGVLEGEARERGESLELGEGTEPTEGVLADAPAPTIERETAPEIPHEGGGR